MKVIDLLNKIANGEEKPKKIKYDNTIYEYNEQYDYKNELQINYYSIDKGEDFFNNVLCYSLNDEIEIIEENKDIRKLPKEVQEPKNFEEVVYIAEDLARKINEIIDKINARDDKE